MEIVEQITGVMPVVDEQKMLIHYYSLPGGFTTVSFSDVLQGRVASQNFDGKIILIGATALDLHDTAVVPISNQAMSGVEINANLVQSILFRDYISYQDTLSTLLLIFLFAFVASLILYRFRIHIATLIVFFIGFLFILVAIQLFDMGIIMNIVFPLFSMVLVYFALLVYYYLTEEKDRKWITQVFGKYVSPLVIETLIKNPKLIDLGGERRNISIFFSDIRGFTSISERIKPEELVHLLNEYLTEMTSIILEDNGLVDKYMGDAIMAFWGAPMDQPDHAIRACQSSLEMIRRLKILQRKWQERQIPIFDIGIGINSGDAIVGNMGSEKRFDYTAIGDNVNLASRLEGLNKIYGTNIIISEYTFHMIKERFACRKLDVVKVKGKDAPVFIYELVGTINEVDNREKAFIDQYEGGLTYYIDQKWKQAIESFTQALNMKGDDVSSRLMIQRCEQFRKHPPAPDWKGVWEMKTK
jgi:adenylate cyclase